MKTLVLISFLVTFVAAVYARNEYDFGLFSREIDEKCLNRWWTNSHSSNSIHPLGFSLEGFISLVEKIEEKHHNWDMYKVTKELLKRFAFEEIEFRGVSGERQATLSDDYQHRWTILSKLIPEDSDKSEFNEEDLTDQEKCSLFFMMGHVVNNTFRENFDDETLLSDVPQDGFHQYSARVKTTKKPREQGVVSVGGDQHQAIAISKVLNAIVTGRSTDDISITQIRPDGSSTLPKDRKINPLIGVTLGDILTIASVNNGDKTGTKFFGPGGIWNDTACPTEFVLHENATGSTNALLRGAVDGLQISHALDSWGGNTKGLRLSRVLRTYYSKEGLPLSHGSSQGVSYCRRQDVISNIGDNNIRDSVVSYYYLFSDKKFGQAFGKPEQKVGDAMTNMMAALGEIDRTGTKECEANVPADKPICETPANVFVVLDTSEANSDGFRGQLDVIGRVSNGIDFGIGSGSLSIFYDSRYNTELKPVSFNNSNPTCAVCKAIWPDESAPQGYEQNEINLLDGLNKTLWSYEAKHDLEPGVPSRTVVLFHYGNLREQDKNRVRQAANIVHNGHRDTRLLVVGSSSSKDDLSVVTREATDVLTEENPEFLAEKLHDKICRAPAIFQFNRCWDHKKTTRNENENKYVGFVTPNHVQFWAFHPEYYLKSYNIKVTFRVDQGHITVCHQRAVPNPGFTNDGVFQNPKGTCQTSDDSNKELVFKINNPCEGYHVHNCPTMNFAIVGENTKGAQSRTLGCDDPQSGEKDKCRRLDQIKFEVEHDGVSCNGCGFLKASPLFVLIISFFYYLKKF